jgi:hypothetical protein
MSCIQLYYVCVFIGINRTDEALPMSCIQMYYVCVFTDIIGQTGHYQCPDIGNASSVLLWQWRNTQYICIHDIGKAPSVLLCQWRHTHSTFVYMTVLTPRLSYYVNEDTNIVFIDNRTDEALPMSCIQMYYVCVFTDIIGQTGHYQCHVYNYCPIMSMKTHT